MVKQSLTAKEMAILDKVAIRTMGIPSLALMENAGRSVADAVMVYAKRKKKPHVGVVCGIGHNAGDGFVAARHLMCAGVKVKVFMISGPEALKDDARIQYRAIKKLGVPIRVIRGPEDITLKDFAVLDVIVDAIFGCGLNRAVKEPYSSIIKRINFARKYVVAVDVPSGLDASTGEALGVCVNASRTVTFTVPKKGLLKKEGVKAAGYVEVVDIGFPKTLVAQI